MKKAADQKAAGVRVMTGSATIQDLVISDEDNFATTDTMIEGVLDAEQLELFEQEQIAREEKRIAKKTEEELGDLVESAELTEEQQEAAWEVLAEIHAGERPGGMPEGTTGEEFVGIIDEAIANRVNALEPILSGEQMEVYHAQVQDFRKMITGLVGHATG